MLRLIGACAVMLFSLARAAQAETPGPFAGKYCAASGGTVQTRIPTFGTNGGTPLTLAGPREFCDYTGKDGSHIDVLLTTLVTKQPSLAALAYYAQVAFISKGCNGGPGSCYCSQVGGTDEFGGINLSGGGWVLSTNNTDVLDACIFPDLSSIDAYGLFYHSAGIIRGKTLVGRLRYPNPY